MVYNKDTFSGPSFSLTNRLARLCWHIVWLTVFRLIPTPFHEARSIILRIFGAKIGISVHVYPRVRIWAPWNLSIGDGAGVANDVVLYSQGKITLGKQAVISQGSHLCAGSHDYEVSGMPLITAPIAIGAFAWVTAEVFVHPGVTVGDGAIIGARSVVNRDIPAWMVCAGNPCKPIKQRNWRPNSI